MIYSFLHTLVAKFVLCFIFWIPEIVIRKRFELKNKKEIGCKSFKEDGISADMCFEFSSEGEFAQINSLVEDALKVGKKIELVMFSPSVEKQVMGLYEKYPEQIRYLRYPILTYAFWSRPQCFSQWVSSSVLYLVRYDFFPEFLFWARKGHTLKLLWLSFKKSRLKNKQISFLKRMFLLQSKLNVFATQEDLDYVSPLGVTGIVYDFRMEQIFRRNQNRKEKFSDVFKNYEALINHLKKTPSQLILGNAWLADIHLLEKLPEPTSVLIVPHQLDESNLASFQVELEKLGFVTQLVDDETSEFTGNVLILNKKGVLCELYADFSHAYVGGGFGVSVHSILEPLVNGVPHISCGPVNHRSTEFDVAESYQVLTVVHNAMDFAKWLEQENGKGMSFDSSQYELYRKEVIGC
ncbi:MAG: hypothetical protein WDA09_06010 [Bacteriovoracaceae bacterium]